MSEKLLDMIEAMILRALEESVSLDQLRMAIHDQYIELDDSKGAE